MKKTIEKVLQTAGLGEGHIHIQRLQGGLVAETFEVVARGCSFIVRLNREHGFDFAKDDYVGRTFTQELPVPRVRAVGVLDEVHYCLATKMDGETKAEMTLEMVPAVLDGLIRIAKVDVTQHQGFGSFDGAGRGPYATWTDTLTSPYQWRDQDTWEDLYRNTCLDRDWAELLRTSIAALAKDLPPCRALIHGDFFLENLLWEENHISAMLDWGNAMYGDPLYDLVHMAERYPHVNLVEQGVSRFQEEGFDLRHLDERVGILRLFSVLHTAAFFAELGRQDRYEELVARGRELLERGDALALG